MSDDYLHDIDPGLADVAGQMSKQIDELTRPIPVPSKVPVPPKPGPLDGFTKAPFFEPAAAFSGQDLKLTEALYNVVSEVWLQYGDHAADFQTGMGQVLSKWSGTAADECAINVGGLVNFVSHGQQEALLMLANGLATYAAIIQAGRDNIKTLMENCVNGWSKATHDGEVAEIGLTLTVLATIATGIVGVGTGGSALPALASVVGTAITGAAKFQLDFNGKHADIANAYLKASRDVVAQAIDGIDSKAAPNLDRVLAHPPQVPTLPVITDHTTFHPEHAEPNRLSGSPAPGKIEKRLG